jgi:hypothetical protein
MASILDLSDFRIGYSPSSKSLLESGDRRRFCSYSNHRNFSYEIADYNKEYDIVFLSYYLCDIPKWIEYKKKHGNKTKIIFELVDSYLFENNIFKLMFRGASKFIDGTYSKIYLDYKKAIIDIIKISDAVVCTTFEQKKEIEKYNKNVHILLDITEDDVFEKKNNFSVGNKLKLVWEGMPYTLNNLLVIKEVLEEMKDKIELHIITDELYHKYSKKYFLRKTEEIVRNIDCEKYFHKWDKSTFSSTIVSCDLAIIPIDMRNIFAAGKPENKLILFWQHQIPVITSNTPAYVKAMNAAGLEDMNCINNKAWLRAIKRYFSLSINERKNIINKSKLFINAHHSLEKRLALWDKCFESIAYNLRKNISTNIKGL